MALSKITNDGVTGISIDSSGIVTMPNTVMVDMWRLASSFATNNAVITGWEQPDHTLHSNVGSSMTVSSGVFTFPKTGLYRVVATFFMNATSADTSFGVVMEGCTDGSTFSVLADGFENSTVNSNLSMSDLVNITDISNRKIRFQTNGLGTNVQVLGESNRNRSFVIIERIADSQ
jgi:hypothetical protein